MSLRKGTKSVESEADNKLRRIKNRCQRARLIRMRAFAPGRAVFEKQFRLPDTLIGGIFYTRDSYRPPAG